MKIGNIFTKFANSKVGKKLYKTFLDPKNKKALNVYTPVLETAVFSSFYIASTAAQKKKFDKDSYQSLQIQNILSFITSVAISIPLNKKVSKFGDELGKRLKPELVPDIEKVITGIKVGLPIMSSTLVSRFLVAVALVPVSSKIRDAVKTRNAEKQKLNTIV